jgi:hypothetical protein
MTEDVSPSGKARIRAELDRIEESAEYSAQAQFEQAKLWRGINLLFGVPTAALAGIAGATALASTTDRIVAGIIALCAAGLGAVAATLNASQRTEQAQAAGNLYLALQSDARIAREIDLDRQTLDDARGALADLRVRQDEINQGAGLPSFYAYWRARRNLAQGRQTYAVDEDEDPNGT